MISETYINALLADATYAERLADGDEGERLAGKLSERMTPQLAEFIAANFEIVAHKESDDTQGSGFDATVWRGKTGTEYAGKVYVSMQGTAGLGDFLTDVDLSTSGAARTQLVDMVNWWSSITTPTGQQATQIRQLTDASGPSDNDYFEEAPAVAGTGQLLGVTRVTVNGHSLGGHLAAAFARLFGGSLTIDHVATFNSAGFNPLSNRVFTDLESLLGTGAGRFLGERQNNYFAQHGLNVTTNTFFNSQIGTRVELFNEHSGLLGTHVPDHFMYKLTDALALATAMEKLDPNLTIAQVNTLLEAAAGSQVQGSLEGVLDGLRRLILGGTVTPTPVGDANDSTPSRVSFHEGVEALTAADNEAFQALTGKVTIETLYSAAAARDDFAALLSLTLGLSFSVRLTEPEVGRTATEALRAVHAPAYQQWLADRDRIAQGADRSTLNFTDAYLYDRVALLSSLSAANLRDLPYDTNGGLITGIPLSAPIQYEDRASGSTYTVSARGASPQSPGIERVVFGTAGNDTGLEGRTGNDRIYAGSGGDTLNGREGNDYLEGGTGYDTYHFNGSFGHDTVLDADQTGNLWFDGEALTGTMKKLPGSSNVWVDDAGKFVFVWQRNAQTGLGDLIVGRREAAHSGKVVGTVTVRNFGDAELGLTLSQQPATFSSADTNGPLAMWLHAPTDAEVSNAQLTADVWLNGVREYTNTDPVAHWIHAAGFGGQVITTGDGADTINVGRNYNANNTNFPTPQPGEDRDVVDSGGGNDVIYTGFGSDVVNAGAGNDTVFAAGYGSTQNHDPADAASSDLIDGGAGDDQLYGSMGGDLLFAGEGNDGLTGLEGSDVLIGGVGDDGLAGDGVYALTATELRSVIGAIYAADGGDDLLDGGEGRDRLVGGVGRDQLLGGGGNDTLYGDTDGNQVAGGHNMAWLPGEWHGSDTLDGGDGNDYMLGGGADDRLLGGLGNDRIAGDQYDGGTASIEAVYHGADWIDSGEGSDIVHGDGGNDSVHGGAGDDQLWGDDGEDLVDGGAGVNALYGGAGSDRLVSAGDEDQLEGGAGADVFAAAYTGPASALRRMDIQDNAVEDGVDLSDLDITSVAMQRSNDGRGLTLLNEDAGISVHMASFFADDASTSKVSVNLGAVTLSDGVQLSGADIFEATRSVATEGDDSLLGYAGDDVLAGLGGNDSGAGTDTLVADSNGDQLFGGEDADRVIVASGVTEGWLRKARWQGREPRRNAGCSRAWPARRMNAGPGANASAWRYTA